MISLFIAKFEINLIKNVFIEIISLLIIKKKKFNIKLLIF